ncbi:FAD-dependent oxidoreductase [Methylopila sp. 73B]|uniref:FAD-dependent oxidoreductase n=1 Tax=Methylopila sp. 73B TaxID=1120792 RepID=UPI0009DD7D38|nr:FAD-dependent oxidoreductase [Methylopila sp. 73B]
MSNNAFALTRRTALLGLGGGLLLPLIPRPLAAAAPHYGVLVYGGTPSGVMAAYAAAREGQRVALVLGPNSLGGMCANGLGWSDAPNQKWIGGLAMEFFRRVGKLYGMASRETLFEPSVALRAFKSFISEAGIEMYTNALAVSVGKEGVQLKSMTLTTGATLTASAFVDASYEGDLMALAGVTYIYGREPQTAFNEDAAGYNQYPLVRSYKTRDSAGRLLLGINPYRNQAVGSSDKGVQAYTFRLCLSDDPKNKALWKAPAGYNPDRYLFDLQRIGNDSEFIAGPLNHNRKFDRNGNQPGASWGYPNGTRAARDAIWKDHYNYQAGLMYFYATDKRVPANYREQVNAYGLALDEFTATGNWPRQLYIRSGRRLRGRYIFRQKDTQTEVTKADSIGVGSYSLDCHTAQYQETAAGKMMFEGTIPSPHSKTTPYQIPFASLYPHEREATNLLVSVCVSATHVGIASLRMEPQYMMMGEAAGVAAAMLVKGNTPVQKVSVADLQKTLRAHGAVLSTSESSLSASASSRQTGPAPMAAPDDL